MKSTRQVALMTVLLVLIIGYVGWPYVESWLPGAPKAPAVDSPLQGANQISDVSVHEGANARWKAEIDYFYTGAPVVAQLRVGAFVGEVPLKDGRTAAQFYSYAMPQRGRQRVTADIHRPNVNQALSTTKVVAQLVSGDAVIAEKVIERRIDWPTFQTWAMNLEQVNRTPEQNFEHAVGLIDAADGPGLEEARMLLERRLHADPKFAPAYVELARVSMKTNWGPEGLRQAESYLKSALQIQPGSVNAKILLGYVYAHQKRYGPAEGLFAEAAKTDTRNQWLWVNWGEMLEMQAKPDAAAKKYREALARPRTHDTYDRARQEAYERLVTLLKRRKDHDAAETVYKQQLAEFGPGNCFVAQYARFLLQDRGDAAGAIKLARDLLDQRCTDILTREVLGLAYYTQWVSASGAEKQEVLNQARVYFPSGPKLLVSLAASDRTFAAARALVAAGEPIDQKDNSKATALTYALRVKQYDAARRLLSLGARADLPVGWEEIPLGILVVVAADVDGVRLLQRAGVDFATIRYRGFSALDYAKQSGNDKLIEVLNLKGRST